MNDPILGLLGLAARAGKLSFGTHATLFSVETGKAKLVCAACDISAKSVKELRYKASGKNIPVTVLEHTDSQTLSHSIGKKCGIIAVNDDGFAKAVLSKAEKLD